MSESDSLEISIVMPCLNEAQTLKSCIEEGLQALAENNLRGEVVIADNGSTDGSPEIAAACGARVVRVLAKGYGNALRAGIEAARGRYVLMGDADGSYNFGHVKFFVEELRKGYDLVMGNRFKGGVAPGAMPWKNHYIGNPILSLVGRVFFRVPCKDFHCGLRAFSKEACQKMALKTGGMEFASEMVIRATLLNMKISEIPTTLRPDGRNRPPHLRPWRDGWRHLRFMLLYSPRWLFLYPGLFFILTGLVLGARLLYGPLQIGSAVLDVHTLFFCAIAILMGFQSVLFAVMTKVFAIQNELVPPDGTFKKVMKFVSLEAGLVLGGIALVLGFLGAFAAVFQWGGGGFGELSPREVLRLVIPGGSLLALGVQIILGSFFLSILNLKIFK
ncbi:MAG: glycosyltransferase family 2 protein [Puniceicoccales bacterium]|jgi:glycosyltransferase involved in cell wall biosynthesis|nr:glycosyltransferase family 2 protein [Puniceicoccales bacterium]